MTDEPQPEDAWPQDVASLRRVVREFLDDEADRTPLGRPDSWFSGWDPGFSERLARRGWVGMTLPVECRGGGRNAIERHVVIEELLAAGAPVAAHWVTDRQAGPASLAPHGTEEHRRRLLHRYRAPAVRVTQAVVDATARRLDLTRAALMVGAARRAADLTIAHVTEREQFGRPLATLPTVKQELARLVGEVDLVSKALLFATDELTRGDDLALAAACTQARASVAEITRIAHQLHGAIGFIELSSLRHATLRLWSWRDDWTRGPGHERLGEMARNATWRDLWRMTTGAT